MKRLAIIFFIILFIPLVSFAKEVSLNDDATSENEEQVQNQEEEVEVLNGYVEYYPDGTVFFVIKDAEGNVLHTPNNWKTEKGALNWAKKNGLI